ncbi:MAG: STM3941 family protein [Phycisphaerales bacterium]
MAAISDDDPSVFVARPDPVRTGGLAVLSAVMTMGSVWMTASTFASGRWWLVPVGVIGTLFFGAALVLLVMRIIRRAPVVVIDHRGISMRGGRSFVAWSEIVAVDGSRVERQPMLEIELHDRSAVLARLGRARIIMWLEMKMGYPGLYVSFAGLDRRLDDALEFIDTQTECPIGIAFDDPFDPFDD